MSNYTIGFLLYAGDGECRCTNLNLEKMVDSVLITFVRTKWINKC